jgi:hypothetical protein
VTHRTTPSEELRGLEGLWRYLITRSDLKAGAKIAPERDKAYVDHRDRLPDNAGPELVTPGTTECKPTGEPTL